MRWLLDGKLIDYPRKRENGKFHREIYYRIQTEGVNQPSKISCQVLHETSQRPITRTEDVIVDRECKRSCHSGFIGVLVLLLVVSLPAVWYFTKRVFQRFQVSPIHMRETEDGNNVTLYCTASNCAKEPLVTWTIKEKDKEEMEITDNNQERDEETPLVGSVKSSGYTMRTERSHADKLHHVMSSLSFAPTGLKHREIAVTCKFQCDGRSQEKSRMCSFLIRKPEVSGPVLMSLGDNGDVLCSLCLQKFYPKRMKIQWSHGLGQFKEVETNHETFIRNDDMTYNVRSECRVPGHLFKDEGFRVRAAWSHEKESGQREATITDTQWLPVMGKMENPPFIDGKEAKLLCQVSGYFPNVLDVKWLRRDAGGSDPCLISASEKYIIPEMEATQQEDKTFSYTACLVVSVSAPTDHGSEFICRVRHPSLKTPQEQRSGELRVIGILAVNVVRLNTDKLRAEVIHVNPDNGEYLKITWSRCEGKKDYKKYEDTEVEEEKISSSDGSSTRYSRIYIESKKKKKYYRVMVEHSASSRVEEKNILRENDEFYLIDKEERKTLLLQVSEQVVPGKKKIITLRHQKPRCLSSHLHP
ncbi:hypothetical protein GDO81_020143 [Engystomops pustulosus]|uniref:Ig-like domain-containing protein n=1 Tax=Engystomops pustulosus TaxID=76066 RepID=A0AAV6Z9Q3_ENGPU|nr:hypothetical protein GDO81_020143 [Engystomops pustulosus]